MSLSIYLNGRKEEIAEGITIKGLLNVKEIKPKLVSVELNDSIIQRDKYSEVILKAGDKIELICFMAGGAYLC